LKARLLAWLARRGYAVHDLGTHTPEPCDYPRIGADVAQAVAHHRADRGRELAHEELEEARTDEQAAAPQKEPERSMTPLQVRRLMEARL